MAKKIKTEEPGVEIKREDILDGIFGSLAKTYGKKIIRNDKESLDEKRYVKNCIKTGSIKLDKLFGAGGLPYGKVVEVRGRPSHFKTGLLECIAAEAQKQGFLFIFADAEHRFDPDRAAQLGVDVEDKNKFLLITPDSGEQIFSIIEAVTKSVNKVFVIIDSLSALLPQGMSKKSMDDGAAAMGAQARLISEGLLRLVGTIAKSDSILAVTNQYRTVSAGIFMFQGVSGGNAPKYYASYIMEIKKWDAAKELKDAEGNQIGQWLEIYMDKSSSDYPGRSQFVPIHLGYGIWRELEALELGIEIGAIEKRGSIYDFPKFVKGELAPDEKVEGKFLLEESVKGKDASLSYLKENKKYFNDLVLFLRRSLGLRN